MGIPLHQSALLFLTLIRSTWILSWKTMREQAFNMYQYKGMQVQQSACPQAFFRLHPLLDCLLVSYRPAQVSMLETIIGGYCSEVWMCGRCADSIGTLMNHWRRATASPTSWSKFCEKLDKSQAQCLERLYKKTGAKRGH